MVKGRSVPLAKFLPNFITFFGLCVGLTSVRLALIGRWELAIAAVVIAAVLDGIDGRIARLLDSSSHFGTELDSLADMVSFGVAPAFILYLWELHNIKVFGWGITMMFVVCMAVRLARFNASVISSQEYNKQLGFFYGIPAPIGGIFGLLPIILIFACDDYGFVPEFATNHYFLLGYLFLISMLTVSRIPTFSFKNVAIPQSLESVLIFTFVVIAIAFVLRPWITISVLAICYALSIPVCCLIHSKELKNCSISDRNG